MNKIKTIIRKMNGKMSEKKDGWEFFEIAIVVIVGLAAVLYFSNYDFSTILNKIPTAVGGVIDKIFAYWS